MLELHVPIWLSQSISRRCVVESEYSGLHIGKLRHKEVKCLPLSDQATG